MDVKTKDVIRRPKPALQERSKIIIRARTLCSPTAFGGPLYTEVPSSRNRSIRMEGFQSLPYGIQESGVEKDQRIRILRFSLLSSPGIESKSTGSRLSEVDDVASLSPAILCGSDGLQPPYYAGLPKAFLQNKFRCPSMLGARRT